MSAGLLSLSISCPALAGQCPALLDHNFKRLQDEKPVSMCQYSGQVLLVVNTASFCGYTNQYKGLEKLHDSLSSQGFSVIGFPSGDFGGQEYKSDEEIADFCANTFGVKFPMFSKSSVKGVEANPLYKDLIAQSGQEPRWNFHKYLVGRDGKVLGSYSSSVTPDAPRLREDITKAIQMAKPQ